MTQMSRNPDLKGTVVMAQGKGLAKLTTRPINPLAFTFMHIPIHNFKEMTCGGQIASIFIVGADANVLTIYTLIGYPITSLSIWSEI